jgi:hypothetical protein
MSPVLSRYAWSASSTKMVSIFTRSKEKIGSLTRGSLRLPIRPYPGKTAKSASPIASPGQGLCIPMHVADHRWGCGSSPQPYPQVTDFPSSYPARNTDVSFSASEDNYPNG